MLLKAPKVPDNELAVAGRGGELVRPVLVARHDFNGAASRENLTISLQGSITLRVGISHFDLETAQLRAGSSN